MKLKIVFVGLSVALVVLNVLPVYAADFSGYLLVEAYGFEGPVKYHHEAIQDGAALRMIGLLYLINLEAFPLTEAILRVKIIFLTYRDDGGNFHTTTDPAEMAQFVQVENSDELWEGDYVIWLGTIKPGGSKRFLLNLWISSQTWAFGFQMTSWYLASRQV